MASPSPYDVVLEYLRRRRRGLSYARIGLVIGTKGPNVGLIFRKEGGRTITWDHLEKMCKSLQMRTSDLLWDLTRLAIELEGGKALIHPIELPEALQPKTRYSVRPEHEEAVADAIAEVEGRTAEEPDGEGPADEPPASGRAKH